MKRSHVLPLFFFILAQLPLSQNAFSQFLHRSGKMIVDGNNQEFILRGMGLGGWMLQEGYMLETNSFANTQTQIRAKISDLIGEDNTQEFYDAWLANHCTKTDIDSLASWGFNSVRLPMHYNLFTLPIDKEPVAGTHTWLDKGFAMTDSLLRWCAAHEMYLVLDLHAAPGGQGKDAAISDYDTSKPSLWESEANKQKTIALWRKLADRYKNEKWIGGYDLINETNWAFQGSNVNGCDETVNAPLKKLLMDITTAIREVDQNHLIMIEGNCWANNHNGLLPYWDNNMALSFHKYWNFNDQGSVQGFVNLREQHNVPLWLGESGENSNVWFRNAIKLMEDNKIGWAWWPMKKIGSVVNPVTVVKTNGYQQLLDYWKNGGTKPSVAAAKAALMEQVENLKIENNIFRRDMIDAMFRQVQSNDTKPFTSHHVPGVIHTSDFDLGRYNKAYVDTDTGTFHVSVGAYTPWNRGWVYRNDGVDIQEIQDTDVRSNGYTIGWTNDGEWMQYTVTVDSSAVYDMEVRYAMPSVTTSSIQLLVDGVIKTSIVSLPATGSYATHKTHTISGVVLKKGIHKLRLLIQKGGANISYLNFVLKQKVSEINLKATGAIIEEGKTIQLSVNKDVDNSTHSSTHFTAFVNGESVAITNVSLSSPDVIALIVDTAPNDADVIKLSYNGDDIKATDATLLEDFSNLLVQNKLPYQTPLPGKLEAENFYINEGLQIEPTSDPGGGYNIGHTTTGDYAEYRIRVGETGDYIVEARLASNSTAGKIQLDQMNAAHEVINSTTFNTPVTNGWQTWTTVSTSIKLDAGSGFLRMKVLQPEFNLNWITFNKNVVTAVDEKQQQPGFSIYPNPADSTVTIVVGIDTSSKKRQLIIRNIAGKAIKKIDKVNTGNNDIDIQSLPSGAYVVELKANDKRYTEKLIIKRP